MKKREETLLGKIEEKRGFRYGLHDFLAQMAPDYLEKLNQVVEAGYLGKKALDRKTRELIIIAVCTALGDDLGHLGMHMKAAVAAGATPQEVLEAIILLGMWTGGVRQLGGFEAWRQTFAPHLPPVNRVVTEPRAVAEG